MNAKYKYLIFLVIPFFIFWSPGDKADVEVGTDWYRPAVIKNIDKYGEFCVDFTDNLSPNNACYIQTDKMFEFLSKTKPVANIYNIPELGIKEKGDLIDIMVDKKWVKAKITNVMGENNERTIYYSVIDWDYENWFSIKDRKNVAPAGKMTGNKKNPAQRADFGLPQKIKGNQNICETFKSKQACSNTTKSTCSWDAKTQKCNAYSNYN